MSESQSTWSNPVSGVLRSWVADIVLRPWFDEVSLRYVAKVYMPLSRAWAAALEGEAALAAELERSQPGLFRRLSLDRVCRELVPLAEAYWTAEARWQEAFFDTAAAPPAKLNALLAARRQAAQRLMASRALLILARPHVTPVAWRIEPPGPVLARHAARLAAPEQAFPAPPPVAIEVSRELAGQHGRESWLRFPSSATRAATRPGMGPGTQHGTTAWAHVYTPAERADPPSVIYLHGIVMETEMWQGIADPVTELAGRGIRVIRPEGPWHGRRRVAGLYGGEPVMARGPAGMIELFEAWIAELGALIAWARSTSNGPVAIGGVSLGALTAQLAASVAPAWPEALRPDALLVVTTTGLVLDALREGALARAIGAGDALDRAGWRDADIARLGPLLEPRAASSVPGERSVVVVGMSDTVTPHEGGRILARRWGVPERNVFEGWHGHFSTPLRLHRNTEPLDRLVAILEECR